MITISSKGDWSKTTRFLKRASNLDVYSLLDKYGRQGVEALRSATPKKTGLTAASWRYDIEESKWGYTIQWSNTNINEGSNIALLIQLGHGTGTGGYVRGRDYINPALLPIFDAMADSVSKEVTDL